MIVQDPGEISSQSPPQSDHQCCYGYGDSLDGIFCQRCTCKSCKSCEKGAHYGYNCSPKVPIITNLEPCHDQNVDEFPQTLPSFRLTCYSGDENSSAYDSTPNLVNDSPNVFNPPTQPWMYSYEFCGNEAQYSHYFPPQKIPICYDDDDEESFTPLRDIIIFELPSCIAITPVLSNNKTKDTLIMRDKHLDSIPKKESDKFIKSNVENPVPSPSEFEDEHECDVPVCDDFKNFSNLLFNTDDDFSSSDDESFSDEDVPNEIYSNPLFNEEIISIKIDTRHFNSESDLIESLLNQDSSIISSSKIDSLLDEFTSELILLKSIPPRIDQSDCDPEEEIRLIEKFLYDNSSPRPPKEISSENSNVVIKSFYPSPILVEDSDSLMEDIDLSLTPDNSMPPGIENGDYDSKGICLSLKNCLAMIPLHFQKMSHFISIFHHPLALLRNHWMMMN
nr:hypothetical protein [Tanacetum cinerariifolium]